MVSTAIGAVKSTGGSDNRVSGMKNNKAVKESFDSIITKSISSNAGSYVSSQKTTFDNSVQAKPVTRAENKDASFKADDNNTVKNASDNLKDSDSVEISDEDASKVEETVKKIADKIKKVLGISDKDLEEYMKMLGFSIADLMQPENMLKLVVAASGGSDAFSVLTDENMLASLKELTDFINGQMQNLKNQLGLSDEQLQKAIADISDDFLLNDNSLINAQDSAGVNDTEAQNHVNGEEINGNPDSNSDDEQTLEQVIDSKLTVNSSKEMSSQDKNASYNSSDSKDGMSAKDIANQSVGENAENMTQNITQTFETVFNSNNGNVNTVSIVRQVVNAINITTTQTVQSMEIQLTPENLGKVNLLVSVKDGIVTAQIVTQDEQVKRAIESQINTLKETFENQGIKVEAVEVTVQSNSFNNDSGFSEADKQNNSSKARRKINLDELDASFDEEDDEKQTLPVNENSSVEFIA